MKTNSRTAPHRHHARLLCAAAGALMCAVTVSTARAQGTLQNLLYLPSNGHWYARVDGSGISWHTASVMAHTFSVNGVDGHLMTPGSEVECWHIRWALGTAPDHVYWIGAYQTGGPEPVGSWRWVTGEPWDFTAWAPGSPDNNSASVGLTCSDESVAAAWGYAGIWSDWCAASSGPSWDYYVSGYLVEFPSADIVLTSGDSDTASFTIESHGVVPPAFTMQVESAPSTWVDLSSTPTALPGGGTAVAITPTPTTAQVVFDGTTGDFQVRAKGTNSFETVYSNVVMVTVGGPACDTIDFNGDTLFPDSGDIDDFLNVFAGGPCSNDPNCGDLDFNNDGLFPDTLDIDSLISVFGGGPCV